MTLPAWLMLSIALEVGGLRGTAVDFDEHVELIPSPPLYALIQGDAQAGPVFLRGSIETDFFSYEFGEGLPFDDTYSVGAGLRFGPLELGYEHMCIHPVAWSVANWPQVYPRLAGNCERVYIRLDLHL